MSVCSLRLLITSSMIWTPYDWLNKFYSFYMAAAVISSGCGLRIEECCGNQPNKSKPALYKPLIHCNSHYKQLYFTKVTRQSTSVIKVGVAYVNICVLKHLKELSWAID